MKRVIVLGSGGSGKSTFARRLGEITGLEVVHLDSVFWRPNWERTPKDEWEETVKELAGRDSWIMDGNFGGTRELRLRACDTAILLDLPRYLCIYRVLKRAIVYRGKSRPDMAPGCNEKMDLEFFLWVWRYRKRGRLRALEQLKRAQDKRIIILRSKSDVEKFLTDLEEKWKSNETGL